MKRLVATAIAAVLLTAGLVVATGGSASAHCAPTQYAGCFRTVTKVTATKRVPKGTRATVCVTVAVASGSATPNGTVVVAMKKRRSTKTFTREVDYFGGKVCIVTRKFTKKGRYTVTATYRSPSGSVFYNSTGKARFKVIPNR